MGKKSFRKVPDALREKIERLDSDSYQVGVRKRYSVADIEAGALAHLNIRFEDGSLEMPAEVLPPVSQGRHSRWNLTGRVVRRTDLPKVERTWGIETPNFGDWSKGSHTIFFTRLVYAIEVVHGQQIPIVVEAEHPSNDEVAIAFRVNHSFNREETNDRDLIFALSLLQENVGAVDVVESSTSTSEWLASMSVDWEFLPVGSRDAALADVARRVRAEPSGPRREALEERMKVLLDLSPTSTPAADRVLSCVFGSGSGGRRPGGVFSRPTT
ncbi:MULTISPECIES: hypothetical protein, partial [unclassified Streptomyces]|uniref:hypothetical protein n=1 Tax=unclassified Streptomyces TaxID=2593676 RepID=UPI0035DF7F8A